MSVIQVRGTCDPAEIAALVAALSAASAPGSAPQRSGYERWRQTRLTAVRSATHPHHAPATAELH